MLSLLLSLAACRAVAGYDIKIHNVPELLDFAGKVNQGAFYRGVTVRLENDIDLSGVDFEPIGKDTSYYFPGTFDGQGHTIRGLGINTTSKYAGLFGYTGGMTLRNVIVDSTSFVESHCTTDNETYVGGLIGYCTGDYKRCVIENSVNMGSVSFHGMGGSDGRDMFLGGLAGEMQAHGRKFIVKNCANYGSVTNFGTSYNARIGGISGYSSSGSIYNCINYGAIVNNGVSHSLKIGGLIGNSLQIRIENSVSMGSVVPNSKTEFAGSFVGGTTYANFSNCYWSEAIQFGLFGYQEVARIVESAKFNTDFVLNESVTVGKYKGNSLLDALNAYVDLYSSDYSRWALNKDSKTASFTVNGENILNLDSQVILLPNLGSIGDTWFDGWYTDEECTAPLVDFEISADISLYSIFSDNNNRTHVITFETRGGSLVEPIHAGYHDVVELPVPTKDRHEFLFWETIEGERVSQDFVMQPYDITLYARWSIIRISNAEEFIAFSNTVNNGIVNYTDKTIYLDNDIEFSDELSKKFEIIGSRDYNFFNGTFDGQGHTISKLTINSTSEYVGIFKQIRGGNLRNVVIDRTCYMVSTFSRGASSFTGPYVGGLVAHSYSYEDRSCTIENIVNMMDITFTGSLHELYIGGVVGCIEPYFYGVSNYVENCVNYGTIRVDGEMSYVTVYMGGVIGGQRNYMDERAYVRDCVNYGNVVLDAQTRSCHLEIHGVIGYTRKCSVKNCTNHGKVSGASSKSIFGMVVMMLVAFFLM